MIGFYDYTVITTYIGLISSVFGMTQVLDGKFRMAVFCLAFSGFCDMLDGKIARTKKNRTEDEKSFGIQIDSLCDVICFGIFPMMIAYLSGVNGILGKIILTYYAVCSVIRLAYFNVLETRRQTEETTANKYYHGLPITSIAVIMPLAYLLGFAVNEPAFAMILHAVMAITATLFIIDFKFKKPDNKLLVIIILIAGAATALTLLFSKMKVLHQLETEQPLIEQIID